MPTSLPTPQELKKIAKSRLRESEILFSHRKYDVAVYLCGYAIELALKARICKTLKWTEFPNASVKNPQTFKTHHLITLLALSGIDHKVKLTCLAEWTIITLGIKWDPELQNKSTGKSTTRTKLKLWTPIRFILQLYL